MYPRLACFVFLMFALLGVVQAKNVSTIHVDAGFSIPVQLPEPASTIVIGNQGIIATNTLKPDLLMINAQSAGATSLTVFGRSGKVYEYRIQVSNDVEQLRSMIRVFEKNVTVEDLNGVIVLKGTVPSPTALMRVLTIADRYISGSATPPNFSVIGDRGGVLTGNSQETNGGVEGDIYGVSPDPRISIPVAPIGGGGAGAGGAGAGGAGGGGGGIAGALRQPLMPIKGNIAQNISRGEVVMVGGGKVMSLVKVAKQPKVEIQMQIVAVDRNKTDEFGIDWRLDATSGNKQITVGSTLGGVSRAAVSANGGAATAAGSNPGTSDLFAIIQNPGRYTLGTFLRFLQQKGAAKTLSSPLVTAISGESASFLVGGNVPIPVQTAFAGNLGGGAAVATNVRFIQFGLKLIVRPTVLENGKISIVLDQSISEPDYSQAITLLGAQIPGFTQRSVSTITESASGESWAVAGLLSEENSKNLDQVPWLSKVPVIGALFKRTSEIRSRNELMILVNARVIQGENDTKQSFDGSGDMAPTDDSSAGDADFPQPELPSTDGSEMPPVASPTSNSKPKANSKSKPGQPKQPEYLDLPEVIVPPEVKLPIKTGDKSMLYGALTIYLDKPELLPEMPAVTFTHPAIKPQTSPESLEQLQASSDVKKLEGRLVYYKEHEDPTSTSMASVAQVDERAVDNLAPEIAEVIQSPAEKKHVSQDELKTREATHHPVWSPLNGFLNMASGHVRNRPDSVAVMSKPTIANDVDVAKTIPSILQSISQVEASSKVTDQEAGGAISLDQATYNLSDLTY